MDGTNLKLGDSHIGRKGVAIIIVGGSLSAIGPLPRFKEGKFRVLDKRVVWADNLMV
jgi:hypothetical protein